jgi:hypothetical protein
MAQAHNTTARIAIGPSRLEGPRDYLGLSTALTALVAALLAAPPETEPTILAALQAQANHDGLDADDVQFMLMTCSLTEAAELCRLSGAASDTQGRRRPCASG